MNCFKDNTPIAIIIFLGILVVAFFQLPHRIWPNGDAWTGGYLYESFEALTGPLF